ncbi:MAG TPA: hypothetical protein PLP29_09295 [Candidatus Ozemobacteraceae bacterium]|nr:hypothetical protein [Candidatus Ozemobacteraceae bacterium]
MPDQAASLRELKRFIDTVAPEPLPGPEAFLAALPTPTPFFTVAVVVPDNIAPSILPLQKWIRVIPGRGRRLPTVWDQGGTLSASIVLPDAGAGVPQVVRVESPVGAVTVLPRQIQPTTLQRRPIPDRIRFLRHLQKLFGHTEELWISIPMTEFRSHLPLLHATDAAAVLVPQHPDAVLRCYEAVKAVHLSGYFSPICLAEVPDEQAPEADRPADRIRLVAKRFLSLDLAPPGMVLSGVTSRFPHNREGHPAPTPGIVHAYDFLRVVSDRILYPAPEDRP